LAEGLIRRREDVITIKPCDQNDAGNVLNVQLAPDVAIDFEKLTRHVFASSSCGLCGKASIEALRSTFPPVQSDFTIDAATVTQLPDRMRAAQQQFERTGGLHAAALFDDQGGLIVLREDVGRHNAVDKVLGFALMNALLPLNRNVLLVSGRSSFEIMQKALAGGVAIVAAVSAPSSLAVEFAKENHQTLIGFLREGRMNIYTHPHRIRT
jgi:FdhD protein